MYVRIVRGIVNPNLRFWVLVFSKYPRARCNLFQSSCVGCKTLFDSSDMVVSRSCLVRVEIYISLATVEWKITCRGSGSRSESVVMSNNYGAAGVLGGTLDLMLELVSVAVFTLVFVELIISSIIPCWLMRMNGGSDRSKLISYGHPQTIMVHSTSNF